MSKKAPARSRAAAAKRQPAKPSRAANRNGIRASSAARVKPRSQLRRGAQRSEAKAASKTRRAQSSGHVTIDHEEIQRWVESRGGFPATVIGTERRPESAGLLRIDFPGYSGKGKLERIEWEEFFEKFEDSKLAFLYDDRKSSRFNKLIARRGRRF